MNFLCYILLCFIIPFLIHSLIQSQLSPLTNSVASTAKEKKKIMNWYVKKKNKENNQRFGLTEPWCSGHEFSLTSSSVFVCKRRAETHLSYHHSIHRDLTFILIRLSSITTFNFPAKPAWQLTYLHGRSEQKPVWKTLMNICLFPSPSLSEL